METKNVLVVVGVAVVLSVIVSLALTNKMTGNVVKDSVKKSVYEGTSIKFTLNENQHTIYVENADPKTKKVTFSIDDSEIITRNVGSITTYKNLRVNISDVKPIGYRKLDSTFFIITEVENYKGVWEMIK